MADAAEGRRVMGIISLHEQIVCVRREIGMRERVYPKWVSAGRMKQDVADREIAAMRAVLATLETLRNEGA